MSGARERFPVLGVTGLPCSGKSLAASMLASGEITGVRGDLCLADDVGHRVLTREDVRGRLGERFGGAIFADPEPAAVRRAIAARVFGDAGALAWLEALVHPLVLEEVDGAVAAARGVRPLVMEAALLFGSGMEKRCERIVLIEADFSVRLARAAGRGWDRRELERREKRQLPLFAAARLGPEKDRIFPLENNGGKDELRDNLRRFWESLYQSPERHY